MTDLAIKTMVLGEIGTNCYIIYRENASEEAKGPVPCVIVDPADDAPFIVRRCRELGAAPEAIFLTHGHFDHILAAEDLRRIFRIPVCAGEREERLLKDPACNGTEMCGEAISLEADRLLRDGETVEAAGIRWRVLFTPGHTEGSVCYYAEEQSVLISGDTLFRGAVGRTDLPTGDSGKLFVSVTEKLFALPEGTRVYPGHGPATDIGHEKLHRLSSS